MPDRTEPTGNSKLVALVLIIGIPFMLGFVILGGWSFVGLTFLTWKLIIGGLSQP